ncbi:MAG: presenilin family intramembrane aspartyl protease PSH [Candidatus Thermoplasmatota archaeon]|nr:presenilin family intramembrane aspartyl protease PSH [Candidatus Thermoplasmatota archaeon]
MKKSFVFTILFLIATQLVAVFVAPSFRELGFSAFEDPDASINVLLLFLMFPIALFVMVLLMRRNRKNTINALLFFAIFIAMVSTFYVLLEPIGAALSLSIAFFASLLLLYLMIKKKSWVMADLCGFILAVGITAMLGISLTPVLMLVLLIALAAYDFVTVYVTKHMVSMAEGVIDLSLPVILVFPENRDFRIENRNRDKDGDGDHESEPSAFFLGLGDIVLPSSYVVSLSIFLDTGIALFAATGTVVGVIALLIATTKTRANAGLPFLCSFAIVFSLIGAMIL